MLQQRTFLAVALILSCYHHTCRGRPATEIQISSNDEGDGGINDDSDDDSDDDLEFYQPKELKAIESTQTSISLEWILDADPLDLDISYRIHYKHQHFEDVKTIRKSDPAYILQNLEPYTQYEIWVFTHVNGSASPSSDHIWAHTDIKEPSAPNIINVTCYDTGQLLVEWTRPDKYYKSVDYYTIYHRPASAGMFEQITIQSTDTDKESLLNFIIENLTGNQEYVIKICAGTKRLSFESEPEPLLGEASAEFHVFLPKEKCQVVTGWSQNLPFEGGELSAGMIVGAVGAVLFLLLAVIGFVVWR